MKKFKEDQRKILFALLAGMLAFSSAGCGISDPIFSGKSDDKPQSSLVAERNDDDEGEEKDDEDEEKKDEESSSGETKETLMVYVVGSNLESQAGAATADLQEMAASGYDADEMNIVVCAGGSSKWWNSSVESTGLNVYEMKDKDLDQVYSMDSENMGDSATVTEFMDYAVDNYPAEKYSIIFWDHGGGAVIGYGADENYGYDMLSLPELTAGIADTSLAKSNTKLDYIGFDACMMGMIEVADSLSGYADYMIASEEVEAGEGWDYDCLKDITDNDAYNGADASAYYIRSFQNFYDSYGSYSPDYTLSCIDLAKVPDVVSSLETLVASADSSLKNGDYSRIAQCRNNAKAFGMLSSDSFYDYIDLYSLADSMNETYPDQAKALCDSIDAAVVDNGSNIPKAHGISIYFPYQNKDYADEWVAEYEKNGFSDTYTSFIKDFVTTLQGDSLSNWDIAETVPEQEGETPEYYVQLTEDEIANYAESFATIWQKDGDSDSYICWINSKDVTLSEDGKLSSQFNGDIFYLKDSSGNSQPCCATEIDRTDDYTKYAIPVLLVLKDRGITNAYIHVKVDASKNITICGVYKELDSDSELYPDKDIIEIKDGDEITPFLFGRNIVFNDDQTVAPFDEWEFASGMGSGFTVNGDFSIELKPNEDTTDSYVCLFRITDTQGNKHFTNYLEMSPDSFV